MVNMLKRRKFYCLIIFTASYLISLTSCYQPEAEVIRGREFISKSLFYKGHFPGGIRNIQVGNFDDSIGKEIVILSRNYCFIFDESSKKLKKTIKFKRSLGIQPEVLDITDNIKMIVILKGGGFGEVGLVNEAGEFIWKYNPIGTSPRMTFGDMDKDGELEFYVADKDGLHRLNFLGEEIWKTNLWEDYIDIYNPEGDKTPLVVTRGYDGNIRFYNDKGELLKEVKPRVPIYELEIVNWPHDYSILAKTSNAYDYITIMNFKGEIIFQYKLEKKDLLGYFEIIDLRGVPVRLDPLRKKYLSVIAKFRASSGRSMLSIFSPEGQLVYQELLNKTRGINVVENPDGSESLLVGDGTDNVWIYQKR